MLVLALCMVVPVIYAVHAKLPSMYDNTNGVTIASMHGILGPGEYSRYSPRLVPAGTYISAVLRWFPGTKLRITLCNVEQRVCETVYVEGGFARVVFKV